MKCPNCGADLPQNAVKCPSCGVGIVRGKYCPHCRAVIPSTATVCPQCKQSVGGGVSSLDTRSQRQSSFRWWRIPIYILVLAIGFGAGSVFTQQAILNNVASAFSQFTTSSEDSESSKEESSSNKVVHITKHTPTPEPPASEDSGALGEYEVSILEARSSVDYEGKPAIIVGYRFTNHSDENQMFMVAIKDKAFQNGSQLEPAVIGSSDETYNSQNLMKEVQPGGTLEVEQAYLLQDVTNNVTVEVTEMFGLSKDEKLTKTFTSPN